MARIVVFGATGYTGGLVAEALVGRGERPVLAARGADRVRALAAELGGLESAVADVGSPETVRALVERGDVLVATVGPFVRYGRPAVEAAVDAGALYIDSTGEPAFIREVFERYEEIPFRQRLYTVEELAEIYDSVGMRLANTFSGSGKPRTPKPNQFEIFVEGRK